MGLRETEAECADIKAAIVDRFFELGRKLAYKDAMRQVWPLALGSTLEERLDDQDVWP